MRAARYAEGLNADFVDFVVRELPYLSFAAARNFPTRLTNAQLQSLTI